MTEERRARMKQLVDERRYAAAVESTARQLGGLGLAVRGEDAVPWASAKAALDALAGQDRYHRVWHRSWGVRLRAELVETTGRLADLLEGERAVLTWGRRDTRVGFAVSASAALRALPAHVGPPPHAVGPGGIGSDLLLTSADGASGMFLTYRHEPFADEYFMESWGAYARVVTPAGDPPAP